jgi:serine/threonine protein kinase
VTPPAPDPYLAQATEIEGYQVLPPCLVLEKLGEGGMGAVFRGLHLRLDIPVAVKCLKPGLGLGDPQFVSRFRREARSAALISHQNVIRVFDVAEHRGLHYLIMELVSGESARERVRRRGCLSVGEALAVVHGAALGLGEAHRRGIVHRDIKPDNLLISHYGQVKVADLGLAKPTQRDTEGSMLSLTGANAVMGTPNYMPPEQWESASTIGPAADVWALGATLYYLIAGGDAIGGTSLLAIMKQIVMRPFPDLREVRPDVPLGVATVIRRATAADPAERHRDADQLAQDIVALGIPFDALADPEAGAGRSQLGAVPTPNSATLQRIKSRLITAVDLDSDDGLGSTQTLLAVELPDAGLRGSSAAIPAAAPPRPPPSLPDAERATPQRGSRTLVMGLSLLLLAGGAAAALSPELRAGVERLWHSVVDAGGTDPSVPPGPGEPGLGPTDTGATGVVLPQVHLELPGELRLIGDQPAQFRFEATAGSKVTVGRRTVQLERDQTSHTLAASELGIDLEQDPPGEIPVSAELAGWASTSGTVKVVRESAVLPVQWSDLAGPGLAEIEPGRYWTDRSELVVSGQCDVRFDWLTLADGTEVPVRWIEDRRFESTVPLPDEGLLRIELQPKRRHHHASSLELQIEVDRQPVPMALSAPLPAAVAAEVDGLEFAVQAGPKMGAVLVQVREQEVPLARLENTAPFVGWVPLEPGPNAIELVGVDRLGRRTVQSLYVERTPLVLPPTQVELALLLADGRSAPIEPDGLLTIAAGDRLGVTVSPDSGELEILIGERVVARGARSTTPVEQCLEPNRWQTLSILARNSAGSSEPISCRVLLDTEAPTIRLLQPTGAVEAGQSFSLRGAWVDLSGLSQLTVDGVAASWTAAADDSTRGSWERASMTLTATRDLEVVAVDNAGLRSSQRLRIEVRPAAPPPIDFPGFQPQPGTARNARGHAERIVHQDTGIEFVAIDFERAGPRPLYAGLREVTERQFRGGSGGRDEPKVSISFPDALAWSRGRGLDLPTDSEWTRIRDEPRSGLQGLVDGSPNVGEFVQGGALASVTMCCYRSRDGSLQAIDVSRSQLPALGFRVVYRP